MVARSVIIGLVLAGGVVSTVAQNTIPNSQVPGAPPPQPLQVPQSGAPPVVISRASADGFLQRPGDAVHPLRYGRRCATG